MNSGMGRLIGYVRNNRIRRKIQNYDVSTQLRISRICNPVLMLSNPSYL